MEVFIGAWVVCGVFLEVGVLACVFLIIVVVSLTFLIAKVFLRVKCLGIFLISSHWGCFLSLTLGAWWFFKLYWGLGCLWSLLGGWGFGMCLPDEWSSSFDLLDC